MKTEKKCPKCGSEKLGKEGTVWRLKPGEDRGGKMIKIPQYRCTSCGKRFHLGGL
jgi:DNA-directed RNA polymerase subunit RPC12/RpoP